MTTKQKANHLIQNIYTSLYGTTDMAMCDEPAIFICDEVIMILKYMKVKEDIFLNQKTIDFIDSQIKKYSEVKDLLKNPGWKDLLR